LADNSSFNPQLAAKPIHIAPLQSQTFADSQAETHTEQSHRAERFLKMLDKLSELVHRQAARLASALGRALDHDKINGIARNFQRTSDDTEVTWFQIGESSVGMADPDAEWDRVMAGYKRPAVMPSTNVSEIEKAFRAQGPVQWERIRPLGGGGQSDVFLVRSPARTSERASCLQKIRQTLDEDKRGELAEAIWSYARPESSSELGALKIFKIPPADGMTPAPGPIAPSPSKSILAHRRSDWGR
jgi:hypothetical protein